MHDRPGNLIALPGRLAGTAGMVLSIVSIAASTGWSQTVPPPSSAQLQSPVQQAVPAPPVPQQGAPASSQPPAAREESPGLFGEVGKMIEKSLSVLPPLKSPTEAIDDLNARARDAAKDAGESLSRLTKPSSMATGRVSCPVSANGAANCKEAADKLCQSKGFKEGKSLNADSTEACSAKVLIPGRTRKPDDCRTDYYVTRALCQ